ncbi:MAG: hypothetical protein ACKPKO_55190, partial [Candidatus Fonsibacter sp.]
CQRKMLQRAGTWQVSAAVWSNGIFTTLAAHVMLLLNNEAASRKASGLYFNKDELVVVVCATSRRAVGLISACHGLGPIRRKRVETVSIGGSPPRECTHPIS